MKGFTLIEMIVAIGVIAIMASISVPAYQKAKPNISLSASTRALVSDLRYIQQLSVSSQDNHSISFDISNHRYTAKNTITSEQLFQKNLNNQITFKEITGFDGNEAVFNVTGAAVQNGIIILKNSEGRESAIEIKPSGYVKIVD